ncbi:MAG TPA: ATP-binding protein [Methylocystis sp.]|nr:ATP-binding protein [Methylocystis sp.]
MASAPDAKATSRAETIWRRYGLADERNAQRFGGEDFHRAAVLLGALVILSAALSAAMLAFSLDEKLLAVASADLEVLARATARELSEATAGKRDLSKLGEALERVAPAPELSRGRRILVSDARGRVAAAWPYLSDADTTLQDLFGQDPLALQFADKAGVLRLDLADGSKALVSVRNLPPPFGQVALIHSFDSALAPWRSAAWPLAALVAAAAAALLIILGAHHRQARRRRLLERANHLIRRRLETALARARCGLWDWDIARGEVFWSDSMYEMLGLKAEQRCLSVAELDALLHPADGDLIHLASKAAATKSGTIDHEFRIAGAGGSWVWLRARAEIVEDARGGAARLVGIAIDVTEEKALVAQNAEADLRLRDAIDAISEAFVLWDTQNRLVACNSKFLELHQLPQEVAARGASYREIMDQAAPLDHVDPLSEAVAGRARCYRARLADGRWLQINERRTKDGGYVSVGADITALKENEETLRHSQHRLTGAVADLMQSRQILETQKQQLAALAEELHIQKSEAEAANLSKTLFLANMSHELRTPLNAIIGFSEMMLEQAFGELGSPKYQEYCHDIKRSGAYLLEVFSAVLDMSRLEAGGVELDHREVEVARVIDDAVRHWRPRAQEKHIGVNVKIDGELRCAGDHDALVKTLGILLSNSIKFTRQGGTIRLRASRTHSSILVFVEDNGQGVEREALGRLCAPFVQSRAIIEDGMKGSGLGLAIAKALMHLHRGSLRLRSRLGVGTVVMLRLPAPAEETEPGDQTARLRELSKEMRERAPRSPYAGRTVVSASAGARPAANAITARNPG